MKTALSLALVLALMLAVVPAMAGDGETIGSKTPAMFWALSTVSPAEQVALTPLPDDQLAAIEGQNPCGSISVGVDRSGMGSGSATGSVSCSVPITIMQGNMCSGTSTCTNTATLTF